MIAIQIVFLIFLLGFIFWVSSHLYSSIFHVPYVNSSDKAIHDALKLADLKKGETLLDLGCGRGDALIIAAHDFGAKAVGYEISPLPFLIAKIKTLKYPKIKVYCRDLQKANDDIKKADVIYLYLLNSVLDKIEDQIFAYCKTNTRIVSLAFKFPKHKPTKIISTKNLGRMTGISLYKK
ncbi:MAG: methyltransferase domain-containing protein [Candidatus Berkelbacteria bacterium]